MQFGAAPRLRPQLVDLNVIPPELRRRPFPTLTVGLALVLVGSVLLLYGIVYLKIYSDWEVTALRTRVAQAQEVVRTATSGESAANQDRQRLQLLADDFQVVAERQVKWSEVLSAIHDTPPGIDVGAVSQSGYVLTVHGTAPNYAAAVEYLDRLRTTDLFLNMSIELAGQASPAPSPTPTVAARPSPPASAALPTAAARVPTSAPTPVAQPTATPTPTPTGTPTEVSSPTPSITPTPIPTPLYDYSVASKSRTVRTGGPSDVAYIRGRVVDADGQLVSGVQLRISAEGGGWSADGPPAERRNGTFEFVVTRGKFSVQVLGARSEVAGDLFTGDDRSSELYDYDIVFTKVPPVPTPAGTPGTPTATPTPSPTAVSPGRNIAAEASLSVTNNAADARLSVDGDVNTIWSAQSHPVQSIQFAFSSLRLIDGVELVVAQSPSGSSTHELWIQDETGNWTLQTTFQSNTSDYSVLAYRFSPVKSIGKLYVRTIRGPSHVAWREVRIYEMLTSPAGAPTPTRTPQGPTPTPTSTGTATPTPTPYPMPNPASSGADITSQATLSADSNPSSVGKAIDRDTSTYWSAAVGTGPYQAFTLDFPSTHAVASVELMVGSVDPATGAARPGTAPYRVELYYWDGVVPSDGADPKMELKHTFEGSYADGQVLVYDTPAASVRQITVLTVNGPSPVGWREVRVIEAAGTPTPRPTNTPTPTATKVAGLAPAGPALAALPPSGYGLGPGGPASTGPARLLSFRQASPSPAIDPERPVAFVLLLEVKSGSGYR